MQQNQMQLSVQSADTQKKNADENTLHQSHPQKANQQFEQPQDNEGRIDVLFLLFKVLRKLRKYNTTILMVCLALFLIGFIYTVYSSKQYEKSPDQNIKPTKDQNTNQTQNTSNNGEQQAWYDIVKLNSTSARCLDGSAPVYYISRDGDSSKILLIFIGGAWCGIHDNKTALQSCYDRSKTRLGSSNQWPDQATFNSGYKGIGQQNNFKDWKKVVILYCDGSGHQGFRKQPIQFNGTELYFRGHNNTVQTLQSIQQKLGLFSKAEKVVVGGDSAGGLASLMWSNYVLQRVRNRKVWTYSDSPIFSDVQNVRSKTHWYKEAFASLMKITNVQIDPPVPECLKRFPQAKQNCMFAENIYQELETPLFITQSLYDSWFMPNVLGVNCIDDRSYSLQKCNEWQRQIIEENRKNVSKLLLQIGQKKQNGVWGISCSMHTFYYPSQYYDKKSTVPQNSQNTASNSIQKWLDKSSQSNVYIDTQLWPNNKPCSGLKLKS